RRTPLPQRGGRFRRSFVLPSVTRLAAMRFIKLAAALDQIEFRADPFVKQQLPRHRLRRKTFGRPEQLQDGIAPRFPVRNLNFLFAEVERDSVSLDPAQLLLSSADDRLPVERDGGLALQIKMKGVLPLGADKNLSGPARREIPGPQPRVGASGSPHKLHVAVDTINRFVAGGVSRRESGLCRLVVMVGGR